MTRINSSQQQVPEMRHQVEPEPAEMAARYGGPKRPVLDWRERLACSRWRSRHADRC
jgi:hypothetical protein